MGRGWLESWVAGEKLSEILSRASGAFRAMRYRLWTVYMGKPEVLRARDGVRWWWRCGGLKENKPQREWHY